jgi:hypothetical protein
MPTTPPLMRTRDRFITETTPDDLTLSGRAGMAQIDAGMEVWDAVRTGGTADDKCTGLSVLLEFCREFLALGVHPPADVPRVAAVTSLAQEAFAQLAYWRFEHNKTRAPMRAVKRLHGDYQVERDAYKASKAAGRPQMPPSMSSVHGLAKFLESWQELDLFKLESPFFGAKRLPKAVETVLKKHAAGHGTTVWTPHDAATLLKGLSDQAVEMQNATRSVNFLTRATRSRFMLAWDGRKFRREFGVNYDTGDAMTAYAFDGYGNLFAATEAEMNLHNPPETRFNHSSFNAGKGVISAGIITFRNGDLISLDNMSGHYKPGIDNLHNAVLVLREMGVPLAGIRVEVGWTSRTVWVQHPRTAAIEQREILGTFVFDAAAFAGSKDVMPLSVIDGNLEFRVLPTAPPPPPPFVPFLPFALPAQGVAVAPPPVATPTPPPTPTPQFLPFDPSAVVTPPVIGAHRVVFHGRKR